MKKKQHPTDHDSIRQQDTDTVAPAKSAGFQQVMLQAAQDGIDSDALHRLFWLLNAHPKLLGHQRCLQNLHSLLSTPEMVDGVAAWAGPWAADIPNWLTITAWASGPKDCRAEGMEGFVRPPRDERHHVLMRHGINRHPGAGALWIRHHGDPDPSLPTVNITAPSRAFRLLQWHLFCSQAEARHERSTLDQYLQYDLPNEWPAWPRPAAAVGLALREFSYWPWDTMLTDLPYETRLDDFAAALVGNKNQLLKRYEAGEARQRIVSLVSYFEDFHNFLEGMPTKLRRNGGGGGGGRRKGIPGFIHFSSSPQVFFQPPEEGTDDEDLPSRDFTRVHFLGDAHSPHAKAELEALDIPPEEYLRPVLDLFPADKRPGGISSLWSARQAMEGKRLAVAS